MKIVSQLETQQELDEMKSVMEIFMISDRIRQLTNNGTITA